MPTLLVADQHGRVNGNGPPMGELGSMWSYERLFERYEGGKVFNVPSVEERQINEMLRHDGKAKTLEQVLLLPLLSAPWDLEPGKGDQGETEFVRETLTKAANHGGMSTPLETVIGQMASAILYRRAFFEKVWKVTDDGRLVFDKIAFRPSETCWLARDADTLAFQGFKQRFRKGQTMVDRDIGPDKAFVYIHGQRRDPLNGISDFETCYAIFETKQKVRFLWLSFLENQNIPKAIAKHGNNADGEIQSFARKVATLKGGGVVGIGPDQEVLPFESNGNAAAEFREAMNYLSGEMSGSVLASFTDLARPGAGGHGSYALSKDQSDFFLQSRRAVLREMGGAFTSFVIADLVRWNFGVDAATPTFRFGEVTGTDAQVSVDLFQSLAGSATVNPAIPGVFLELLTERVSSLLELDVDKVHSAIESGAGQSPLARLQGGVDVAARLVAEAQGVPGAIVPSA